MKYNIVFASDNRYVQHLAVAMVSLLENNSDIFLNIYVITNGISKINYRKLIELTSLYRCRFFDIVIDDGMFNNLVKGYHFNNSNYYRLLIADVIPSDIDTVLYLDVDLIVMSSVKELFGINVDKYFVAAVENPGFKEKQRLNMDKNSNYFNSGVMLVNKKKWQEYDIKNKVIDYVHNNPEKIQFVDQCGLNAIINGQWLPLHPKFNQQFSFFNSFVDCNTFSNVDLNIAKNNPVIIHYTGSSKPWHYRNNHPYKKVYWKYLKKTPFYPYIPEDLTFKNVIASFIPTSIKTFMKNRI